MVLLLLLMGCKPEEVLVSPVAKPTPAYRYSYRILMMANTVSRSRTLGTECDGPFDETYCSANLVEAAPTGWLRLANSAFWGDLESSQGVYNFNKSWFQYNEQSMQRASKAGIRVIVVIRGIPIWASDLDCTLKPQYYRDYGLFVNAVVDQLEPYGVWYYELYNEPDLNCWSGGDYAALLKVAYPMIKKAHPEVTIISGGIAGDPSDSFMQAALAGGLADNTDWIGYHAYQFYGNYDLPISHVRALWLKAHTSKPLIMTEGAGARGWSNVLTDTLRIWQADYLRVASRWAISDSVPYIHWRVIPTTDVPGFDSGLEDMGIPNPVYLAFQEARQ